MYCLWLFSVILRVRMAHKAKDFYYRALYRKRWLTLIQDNYRRPHNTPQKIMIQYYFQIK